MQISTKISTQVVLSQEELITAAIEFVKANMEVPADATFAVDFADDVRGDLTAVIDITGTTGIPAPTKGKRSTPAKTTAAAPAAEPKAEEPKANISTAPEDRKDPEDPPFETDPAKDEKPAEEPKPAEPKQDPKPVEIVKALAPGKIFPETGTSAPTPPQVEDDVDPTVKAKSLFANLSKPTN